VFLADDHKPLLIEKRGDEYRAHSQNASETEEDQVLFGVLEAIGGVRISNPDGFYEFNVVANQADSDIKFGIRFKSISEAEFQAAIPN
jgi:hypothetical protein